MAGWGAARQYIVIYHGGYYTLYLHNNVNLVSAGRKSPAGRSLPAWLNGILPAHLHFESAAASANWADGIHPP